MREEYDRTKACKGAKGSIRISFAKEIEGIIGLNGHGWGNKIKTTQRHNDMSDFVTLFLCFLVATNSDYDSGHFC